MAFTNLSCGVIKPADFGHPLVSSDRDHGDIFRDSTVKVLSNVSLDDLSIGHSSDALANCETEGRWHWD